MHERAHAETVLESPRNTQMFIISGGTGKLPPQPAASVGGELPSDEQD